MNTFSSHILVIVVSMLACSCVGPHQATDAEKSKTLKILQSNHVQGVPYADYLSLRSADVFTNFPTEIAGIDWDDIRHIHLKRDQDAPKKFKFGFGSAAVVSKDGLFLTAQHVIDHAQNIWLVSRSKDNPFYGRAMVIWESKIDDIAILKADVVSHYHFELVTEPPPLNTIVIATGNNGSIAAGRITSVSTLDNRMHEIEHTAPTNQGDSGGALIDDRGNLVGIHRQVEVNWLNSKQTASWAIGFEKGRLKELTKSHHHP